MSQEIASPRRRVVAASDGKNSLNASSLVLVAVLLAAGAVLKLTVGSLLASMGMKPNFIIAMYCLAILLIRPRIAQAAVIGLLAGAICQIPMINATPLLNIPSELLGACVCGAMAMLPMKIAGKFDLNPFVSAFVSTIVSGSVFAVLSVYVNVVSTGGDMFAALAAYSVIVLGTAAFNAVFVQVMIVPLRSILRK
ncbi:MAG: hypothetical protein Q4D92_05805 [Slackia sp.]|nr:hypothetical protein [Slackia sp.]